MYRFYFFLFICFNLLAVELSADCDGGLYVVTKPGEIAPNSMIVIDFDGYNPSPEIKPAEIFRLFDLTSPDSVGFVLKMVVKGEYKVTRYFLKPRIDLKPGHDYILQSLESYESGYRNWNYDRWTISEKKDTSAPRWNGMPSYLGFRSRRLGCGPERMAYFCLNAELESQVIVRTRMKKVGDATEKEYYFSSDSSLVMIGRGMCSGGFDFQPLNEYDIRFQLIDMCGNTTGEWSDTYRVYCSPGDTREDYIIPCNPSKKTINKTEKVASLIILSLSSLLVILISLYILKIQFGGNQR